MKLRNVINGYCKIDSSMKKITYMHSHEILFGNDISLGKYCIAIIANSYLDDKESLVLEKWLLFIMYYLLIKYHLLNSIIFNFFKCPIIQLKCII
jgi:hypothetical protein